MVLLLGLRQQVILSADNATRDPGILHPDYGTPAVALPSRRRNVTAAVDYGLLVIGAGPGGYHAAIRGAQLGLKVAVVEKDDGQGSGGLGGVCLNWGCIPSKALLENARLVNRVRNGKDWGLSFDGLRVDMAAAVDRSRAASAKLTSGIGYLLRKHRIELISGLGVLQSSDTVLVGDRRVSASGIVVATGARPRSLPGAPIDGRTVITSRHALELREPPAALAVVGASAIGCELAYYFNAYGSEVRLFEVEDRILPREDPDASAEVARQFRNLGITQVPGANLEGVESRSGRAIVRYRVDGRAEAFDCDKVLVGVGIEPNTAGIGLAEAGVQLTPAGFVEVDGLMRTSAQGVYGVGDVTGKMSLAHVAFEQGVIAAEVAAGLSPEPLESYVDIPRCTYCNPQVASIGLTEPEARQSGIDILVGKVPYQAAGKAVAIGETEGFAKVIVDASSGAVVGAHIVGGDATELIGEIGMLKLLEGTDSELARMVHAHPTLSEVVKEAAAAATGRAIHY
jgi:dihydrolipoamide dehydrogenase